MSDLTKTLKSAIISLTEARSYIQSMPDFLGNYADDVEQERFEKRKKLSAQGKEPTLLDFDENYAVFAYVNLLPDGCLIMLYSLFDEYLFSVAGDVSELQGKPLNYDRGKTGRFTDDQVIQFLAGEVGIQVAERCPSWEKIQNIRRLRDIVVSDHRYVRDEHIPFLQSLTQSSKNFSYQDAYKIFDFDFDFLIEICETMILFFHELEKPLSEISEQQS